VFQQIEILIEGMNPEAGGPLSDNELSRVRAALQPDEHLGAFVRGRIVGAGGGLWVLTERRVLTLQDGRRRGVGTLPVSAVQRLTLEAGRYGSTVALYTADERKSLFAAHPGLAQTFAAALARSLPAGAAATAPAAALPQEQAADVATWVSWSRLRLMPTGHQGMAENLMLLREAATLHERGLLDGAEYGALKGRLLDAA
jgi:hypothetical protein